MPFGPPRVARRRRFGSFFDDFRAPGAQARTVLPLQRELDLARSGGSENGRFFYVSFPTRKKAL